MDTVWKDLFYIGEKIRVKSLPGNRKGGTPRWCEHWTGTIVRLNKLTATVEFEVKERDRDTVRRYVDYGDIEHMDK